MQLTKLSLIKFKNIEQMELELAPSINCFVGDNGTCKTNIVDSVYYLSMCKSALAMTDNQCTKIGEDYFILDGDYFSDRGIREQIAVSYSKKGQKIVKRNTKPYERLSDHIGLIPVVIVTPSDSLLISDTADERRRFINGFISQIDRNYLVSLMKYNGVLAQRNSLLKNPVEETILHIFDQQLAMYGEVVYRKRKEIADKLLEKVAYYYSEISGDREEVSLSYRSVLNTGSFTDALSQAREKDKVNGFTTVGIHRDDFLFTIGGNPLRRYGSQGQQKSFLIAIKLAQYSILSQILHEKPILLLDDVFDKLDEFRVERLMKIVTSDAFGQIFITDCNFERMSRVLQDVSEKTKIFKVTYGQLEE